MRTWRYIEWYLYFSCRIHGWSSWMQANFSAFDPVNSKGHNDTEEYEKLYFSTINLSALQVLRDCSWWNCKLKFTTRFVNKVSDWLLVAKKNQSICSEYLIGSSLLLVANQRLCLQIWLWISICNLITSVATCSEQSRNQNCIIQSLRQ
jgi:hypothetical protein